MTNYRISRGWLPILLLGLTAVLCAGFCEAATKGKRMPKFAKIEEAVLRHFQGLPDYQPGGVISQSEVTPIFGQLKRMGWLVADREAIVKQVLADNSFLIRQLRSPAGKKLDRQIARYEHAYDRLDHLARLPLGRQTVHDLIRAADGYKLIQYMTTTSGGSELGKMLSKDPHGAHFNRPTGRIYTVKMLLDRLKQSYGAAKLTDDGRRKP